MLDVCRLFCSDDALNVIWCAGMKPQCLCVSQNAQQDLDQCVHRVPPVQ